MFETKLCGLLVKFLLMACICNASGPCALVEPHPHALCIPLEAINRAFKDARLLHELKYPISFPSHEAHHHHNEIDHFGVVLAETTKFLAQEFQLSHEQVYSLIPNLDLELTEIWPFCPATFQHKTCKLLKYRSLSGHCNNLNHPDWGGSHSPFRNLLRPQRPDGVDQPRIAEDGYDLPSARVISSTIHRDHITHDHAVTVMLIAWGQIIDHDITFTAESKDSTTKKDPDCCHYQNAHHHCYPIMIPEDDSFYAYHGHHCMNFARSLVGVRSDCRLGPRTAFNSISSYLDASFVYGSNDDLGKKLRLGKYGLLRSQPLFENYGLKDLLPLKMHEPDDGCIRPNSDIFCFLAGDNRVNEQLVLTVLHTIFMREHNSIAKRLSTINPHWNDERLYQETRRIIIAITQHITYTEFLPMILGKEIMHSYGITVDDKGYWNGYDPDTNPTATEEFITSAFRFGHSLLPHRIERWTHSHHYIESKDLSQLIRQPFDMYRAGYADTFIMGLANQLAQAMDEGVTEEVTNLLFREPKKHFGMDLAAMNIQRGRDHGVPGFTAYRKICGLSDITSWNDLHGVMRNETVYKYKSIYRSPHDIDLWSGGVSEIPLYGSLIGPTFVCIIALQFKALRNGDRFWYELPDLPSSFTLNQLHELKNVKLSRILCDNSDSLKTIQVYPMMYPDPQTNPRVPCKGQVLPRIDLEKWRELPIAQPRHKPTYPENHRQNKQYYYPYKDHGYRTLQPPRFDKSYINSSSTHENEFGPHKYYHEHEPIQVYKQSHETSQTPKESPTYPRAPYQGDMKQSTTDHFYEHSNDYSGPIPEYNFNQNDHEENPYESISINTHNSMIPAYNDHENNHYSPYSEVSDHEVIETLEPPPVAPSLVFQPRPISISNYRKEYIPTKVRTPQHPSPFPRSPFPGLSGIFSPNPGYLVRQQFALNHHPPKLYSSYKIG